MFSRPPAAQPRTDGGAVGRRALRFYAHGAWHGRMCAEPARRLCAELMLEGANALAHKAADDALAERRSSPRRPTSSSTPAALPCNTSSEWVQDSSSSICAEEDIIQPGQIPGRRAGRQLGHRRPPLHHAAHGHLRGDVRADPVGARGAGAVSMRRDVRCRKAPHSSLSSGRARSRAPARACCPTPPPRCCRVARWRSSPRPRRFRRA